LFSLKFHFLFMMRHLFFTCRPSVTITFSATALASSASILKGLLSSS
jgi:hypothetical protein